MHGITRRPGHGFTTVDDPKASRCHHGPFGFVLIIPL